MGRKEGREGGGGIGGGTTWGEGEEWKGSVADIHSLPPLLVYGGHTVTPPLLCGEHTLTRGPLGV